MSRRALVVANDAPLRGLLTALLQREELTVSGASTSDEALEQLSADSFEVIVVDLMMPDRGGYQVLHHIRDRRPQALTCLIVITSEVTTDLIGTQGNDPGFHILRKPFEMTAFQEAVRTCLGQERGERPIGVQCLSCDRQESFKAPSEDLAVQLARSEGWHVVTFVRPDPVTMVTKTLFITFCPTCATPV